MEVEVEGWVGKTQNELTVPSQGKALVLFVWRLDCYLLDSRLLSSSLPLLVSSTEEGTKGRKKRQKCWGQVKGEKTVGSGKQRWQVKETERDWAGVQPTEGAGLTVFWRAEKYYWWPVTRIKNETTNIIHFTCHSTHHTLVSYIICKLHVCSLIDTN